ncbi:MAG TPA: hypothetical protein DCS43_14645 [Verrucomicrobia bacterium]|nr:hypothetical protein [Verrucomicrobiota bacterium]
MPCVPFPARQAKHDDRQSAVCQGAHIHIAAAATRSIEQGDPVEFERDDVLTGGPVVGRRSQEHQMPFRFPGQRRKL